MSETRIQKRSGGALKEKGQYLLAFGVVASMLLVAGFPIFVIFFFAIFAYFIFKVFTGGHRYETRDIFEFYLAANEILRDDGRNWFGFELRDALERGESIVHRMPGSPPLVYFALGALYNKAGDHQAAINTLSQVIENEKGNEAAYVHPTPELRNYVKILRKIERDPSEAPLTSAAIRSLERTRRLRGKLILEESRAAYVDQSSRQAERQRLSNGGQPVHETLPVHYNGETRHSEKGQQAKPVHGRYTSQPASGQESRASNGKPSDGTRDPFTDRKPISEVLHDIYDKNVQ
ncbi:MAG: hypothetical protein AB7Q37_13690 [Pyrinomonadaceae bacterium]